MLGLLILLAVPLLIAVIVGVVFAFAYGRTRVLTVLAITLATFFWTGLAVVWLAWLLWA